MPLIYVMDGDVFETADLESNVLRVSPQDYELVLAGAHDLCEVDSETVDIQQVLRRSLALLKKHEVDDVVLQEIEDILDNS